MAVPKRRQSHTRGAKRRSHDAITLPNVVLCPQCGEPKLPHKVCPSCGTYKSRQLLEPKE
ncbi:MAG: 50S ribosomal protein L32 [Deltaproteobacteria bacterium]|nr:50S ribosomal protein L32 [Deltaproteobacteria bacterium]